MSDIVNRLDSLTNKLEEIGDKIEDLREDRDFQKEQAELWQKKYLECKEKGG